MSRWFRASSDASGRRLAWAVAAMFAAVGCEGSVPAVGDAALDTAIDSAVDVPVAACPADQTRCEGRCVDMAIDRSNFADMDEEFVVKLKFKPSGSNGILFLVGNPEDGDYVSLELQNSYLIYRCRKNSLLNEYL